LQFFNFIVLGYNLRLLHRFGLHPSIWEFIHYLKDEEALVSHRITHLGGGGGITSGTLVYVHMQSKSKATETEKQLIRLQDLYYSNFIGLKQYLTSASLMVGKVAGQYTNTNSVDRADANAHSVNNEDIAD
jgi:CRISPR/Cas system CSM-associated protein Csm5 (group 7 of RAMP superfamily)